MPSGFGDPENWTHMEVAHSHITNQPSKEDAMPEELTNSQRADKAHAALMEYVGDDGRAGDVHDRVDEVIEEAGQDLICDLLHLIERTSGAEQIGEVIRGALTGYGEERRAEEPAASQEG